MESVSCALNALKSATSHEIAARTGLDRNDVVETLWTLKRNGKAERNGKIWRLTAADCKAAEAESAQKNAEEENMALHEEIPAQVDREAVRQLLAENGAMKTAELATWAGRDARGMVSVMRSFERAGIVVMNGEGKGVIWSLPANASGEATQHESEQQSDAASASGGDVTSTTTSVQEILQDIPSFTGLEPGGLLSELQRQVTAAKRRHRTEGQRLEEIDSAVRVLNKPCNRGMVEELLQWQNW
ncbi:hypothetical protein LXD80_10140 [Enterobacter sp. ASE]|uniref:hypothetical protein n=1 Tax=Enterobacter sp. ASE TaxID=2905968 RepID=UPI001E4C122C|nr:hypothetical protein [Enterobacter sp. ASE]MCE3116159.1 hypothetical protein [Enterobacter sp. ASE]